MKILKLIIKDYQQFKHLELDFTHPETGEPLDKICFIGRNGTGKSTILRMIWDYLNKSVNFENIGFFAFKILIDNKSYYSIYCNNSNLWFSTDIEQLDNWVNLLSDKDIFFNLFDKKSPLFGENQKILPKIKKHLLKNKQTIINHVQLTNSFDLLIYCPPESKENSYLFDDVPETSLNEALNLSKNFSYNHIISQDTIKDFWRLLIFKIQIRKKNLEEYAIANKAKSYEQIMNDFNLQNPNIFFKIAELWNKILDKAGLIFDIEKIKSPNVLTENLKAYIKLKRENSLEDTIIPYNKLSTGIRNFIFKIGHIYSLYFNRKIERGFLLVDEPENSLFPDFLYDLIDEVYCKIIENQNTQFFVSTHNPIIAAQFEPYERIILDFDDEGFVFAKKGTVPVGDDPNDILFKDFGMRSIYTKKGLEKWEEFIELKVKIRHTTDIEEKNKLIEQYAEIGRTYNFPTKDAISK